MNNKGFSLIEVLIAMAIFGILLTALTAFFISQNRQYVVQSQLVEMQDNARAAMDFVVRMLRNTNNQDPVITGNTCSHTLKFTDVGGEAHEFRRYSGTDGPNTFGYHQDPATGNIQPFALNITCFEVLHVGNQFETIITAETDRVLPGIGQKGSVTLQSTVKPRNLN
jgi:prepilin-type N-terminal cleavage/methylation domain-containing protein